MTLPDDWTCEGQDELDFDDGPNPDEQRDLRIDDDLLDDLAAPEDVTGGHVCRRVIVDLDPGELL